MAAAVAGFSSVDAARLSGASYRQVDYWCRTGRVEPSIERGHGSGSSRRYSVEDVVAIAIIVRLSRSAQVGGAEGRNPTAEAAVHRAVANVLRPRTFSADQCLVLRGTEAMLLSRPAATMAIADADEAITVLPLAPIFEQIEAACPPARLELARVAMEVAGG